MSTLSALISRVREKIDEPVANFWTDTFITNQLNECYRYYQNFILQAFEGYFNKTAYISLNANAAGEYALPADCSNPAKIRLVSRIIGNDKIPLRYYERFDNAISKNVASSLYNLFTYRFRGNYIVFEPAPDFSETNAVEIEYSRSLTAISGTQDVDSEFPALAEDCMVIRSVLKCKGMEEMIAGGGSDLDPFVKDLTSTEQMLKESLENRTTARMYVESFGEQDNDAVQNWSL